MKKRGFVLSAIFIFGFFLLLASPGVSNADFTFNFMDSVNPPQGALAWTHTINEILDSEYSDIEITNATYYLSGSVEATGIFGDYTVAVTNGDYNYNIGNIVVNGTGSFSYIWEIQSEMLFTIADGNYSVVVNNLSLSDIQICDATIEGTARAVPIPSVALLIGTAFTGLAMFRRQVFRS